MFSKVFNVSFSEFYFSISDFPERLCFLNLFKIIIYSWIWLSAVFKALLPFPFSVYWSLGHVPIITNPSSYILNSLYPSLSHTQGGKISDLITHTPSPLWALYLNVIVLTECALNLSQQLLSNSPRQSNLSIFPQSIADSIFRKTRSHFFFFFLPQDISTHRG